MFFTRMMQLLGSPEKRSGRVRLACEPLEGRAMMATLLAMPVDTVEPAERAPSMVGGHVKVFDGACPSSAAGHELGHIQTFRHEHIGAASTANAGSLADEVDTTRAAKPLPVLLVIAENRDLY